MDNHHSKIDYEEMKVIQNATFGLTCPEVTIAHDEVIPLFAEKKLVHPERRSGYGMSLLKHFINALLKFEIPTRQFVVACTICGAIVGFVAHLIICFCLPFLGEHTPSIIDVVAKQAKVHDLYKLPPKEVKRYFNEFPEYRRLLREGYFLGLLKEQGESATRSAILLAFFCCIGALQFEKFDRKYGVPITVKLKKLTDSYFD